jgi:hypothetical protein
MRVRRVGRLRNEARPEVTLAQQHCSRLGLVGGTDAFLGIEMIRERRAGGSEQHEQDDG